MKYRAEIDGLRALAVIPVILFHAGFKWFSGGYIGVDIFFVISGYLITTILIEDIESKRFNIVRFYERRARRILPALIFVIAACIPFAWIWMIPPQMKDFSQSLVAVSVFASNILFWKESGYFDTAAEAKPLLHTWSLAVEEQYYVLFPMFLILAWRLGKNRTFWIISILAFISLAYSEWSSRYAPMQNFYLAPSRAWELFTGSIAAFIIQKHGIQANNKIALIGLFSILIPIFFYDETTPFPSSYTLAPILGTFLLILYADKTTYVARALSIKAMVGIGLISYSAYLWHQPLFAFARLYLVKEPSITLMIFLSIISLLLAFISWKYIETPFRNKTFNRYQIFTFSGLSLALIIVIGLIGHTTHGFESRINGWEKIRSIPNVTNSYCHNDGQKTVGQLKKNEFCTIGNGELIYAIIGDSHAGAVFDFADQYLQEKSVSSLAISGGYCAPLLNGFEAKDACAEKTRIAFEKIKSNHNIKDVILVAEWANYTEGYRGHNKPMRWRDKDGRASTIKDNTKLFQRSFEITIQELKTADKNIHVVMPLPEFHHDAYNYLAKQVLLGKAKSMKEATRFLPALTIGEYAARNANVFNVFSRFKGSVSFIPTQNLFCREGLCYQYNQKHLPLYSDFNHLNYYGSEILVQSIFDRLKNK